MSDDESTATAEAPNIDAARRDAAFTKLAAGLRKVVAAAQRQARISKRLGFFASAGAAAFAALTVTKHLPSPGGWLIAGATALIAVFGSFSASTAKVRHEKALAALQEIEEAQRAAST